MLKRFAATDRGEGAPAAEPVSIEVRPGQDGPLRVREGEPRPLSPAFLGYNGNLSTFNQPWDDEQLVEATRGLRSGDGPLPRRVPSATSGTGTAAGSSRTSTTPAPSNGSRRSAAQTKRYTLENLAKGAQEAGFTPVFMLNMVHYEPAEQVAHLRQAADLGMPVDLVELGNEYYFGSGADAYVTDKFPPEAYAEAAQPVGRRH